MQQQCALLHEHNRWCISLVDIWQEHQEASVPACHQEVTVPPGGAK